MEGSLRPCVACSSQDRASPKRRRGVAKCVRREEGGVRGGASLDGGGGQEGVGGVMGNPTVRGPAWSGQHVTKLRGWGEPWKLIKMKFNGNRLQVTNSKRT